ncbi:MAG: hypothetical protein CM1200mP32_09340 [Methanobacteriota archaeon]|nr:MAG: hypothetical protein CM1200mP32_09340 [Euryarchaeota archaeon]
MFGPATFPAAMAEVVVGSMMLASLCAIGCATATFLPGKFPEDGFHPSG